MRCEQCREEGKGKTLSVDLESTDTADFLREPRPQVSVCMSACSIGQLAAKRT